MPRTVIRFGGYQPTASVHTRGALALEAALAARLGAAVDFALAGNIVDAGRKAADLLGLVESGALTMCYFSSSYLADRVPEAALLDLPFMIRDRAQAYRLFDGPLGRLLTERIEAETGYRVLAFWDNGLRHFSNRVRPIRTPADCAGLRIRTLLSDLHAETFRRLGFDPVALDVKDLLAAVEAGTIDAQDNPLTNIYNFGIHLHHRHITLTGHFFGAALLLCHKASYDGWSGEVRSAVAEAVAEATAAQRAFAAAENDNVSAKLDAAGNEIVSLTAEERAAFTAAVAPVVENHGARLGRGLLDLLD